MNAALRWFRRGTAKYHTAIHSHGVIPMRAAVMRKGAIQVDDVPDPRPAEGEVLVRTLACGICGSDLHFLKHSQGAAGDAGSAGVSFDPARDLVMGHEFCAEVLDYGPATGRRFAPGTRVCSVPSLVRNRQMMGVGYSHDAPGGYGERMILNEALLLPVPNGLSTDRAALTEPMAVGLHAVRMARLTPDDVPLVIGAGPVGLAVLAALKLAGAAPVVVADFSPARRRLAERLGADIVIDPARQSPYSSWAEAARASAQGVRAAVNPLTGERMLPPGVYFECVGVPGVIDQMMVGAERGCRFVVVGVCMEQDAIRPLLAIGKELNLQFVLAYTPEEFAETLGHLAEGRLLVDALITGRVGVEGVAQAFADLASPERHAKILVEPWRA
jgi:threonine dehydrogenase-like Zn-dependent dehydrogenase